MTSHNEICEKCGHFGEIGWCIKCKGFYQNGKGCKDLENNFTPKIEKTEVQTICPLGETIPDFTQEIEKIGCGRRVELRTHTKIKPCYDCGENVKGVIVLCPSCQEKFKENNNQHSEKRVSQDCAIQSADRKPFTPVGGFSTPNCEICKDYPKEYWCGNPENKVSTPDEEIINEIKKRAREYLVEYKDHGKPFQVYEKLFTLEDIKQVLSLKEQENKTQLISFPRCMGKSTAINIYDKIKLLSSLQEKIESFEDFIKFNLILTDIKDEKGNKIELSDELMKLFEIFTEQFIFPKFREIFQEKT